MRKIKNNILFCIVSILFISLFTTACKKTEKPLDLGQFKYIRLSLSLSPDGDNILFDGCGHKDYWPCTVYRFERSTGKLYRYIYREDYELLDGRYSSTSTRFAFLIVPHDVKGKAQYEDIQIAIANHDGSGLQQVTSDKGVKAAPMLSPDEKTIVFFQGEKWEGGSPLSKKQVGKFDLYKIELLTGKETQLTRLEFYGVSKPYFTPDGRNVVFEGDSPLRSSFSREKYWRRYYEHRIFQYPLDGSGIDREPVPIITFGDDVNNPEIKFSPKAKKTLDERDAKGWYDGGPSSRDPMVTKDGSIWFEGRVGAEGGIHYYRRFPAGETKEITYEQLGIASPTRFLLKMDVTPNGRWLATLNEEDNPSYRKRRQRNIRILDTQTNEHYELTLLGSVENIFIQ
jgi:dipeptidyl aminopeptidase/acylaminoacyl peptidase